MHWENDILNVISESSNGSSKIMNYKVNVWAGEFEGKKALDPPANSWAANPENCVLILGIELYSCNGAEVKIPGLHTSSSRRPEDESNRTQINRALYFVDGTGSIEINR